MIDQWKKIKIKDISTKIGDGIHGTPKYNEDGEYYFINGNNLSNGKILIKPETKRISKEEYLKIRKDLNERTILIAINGTLGNLGFYNNEPIALGKSACYINIDKNVDKNFIRYVLEFEHFQKYAYLFATGATIKNLGLKAIRNYPFLLPPFPTQKKIASVLSAYDDLIENNLKRIKLLEEKAQQTYEEWFVRMKFPGYETTSINKETGLPEGWENVDLSDYVDLVRGIEPGSKNYKDGYEEGLIPFIRVGDLSKRSSNIWVDETVVKNKIATRGDVLLSLDGSPGLVVFGLEGAYSTGVRKAISKDSRISNSFIYALLSSEKIQGLINNHASGSTILHAGSAVKYMKFDLPTDDVIMAFNEISENIFKSILNYSKQNQLLKEARDILLPRLMTGMIDVDDVKFDYSKEK